MLKSYNILIINRLQSIVEFTGVFETYVDYFLETLFKKREINMRKMVTVFASFIFILTGCISLNAGSIFGSGSKINLKSESFMISINKKGILTKLEDLESGINYLPKKVKAPILAIRINNEILFPKSASLEKDDELILTFHGDIEAVVKSEQKRSHITFELISITAPENIELVIWGPYPTIINKVIGECVGVVQGEKFAIGIQALNPKTLGGYPWNESDALPQLDIFSQENLEDLEFREGKKWVLWRLEAAMPQEYGSRIQAYCRNRNNERIANNYDQENYTLPVYDDGGIIGSKIAIFGCPVENALDIICEIEVTENLPHPKIDGEWGKKSKTATASYIIMNFNEEQIDECIKITKKSGLRYLYHIDPWASWGKFPVNEDLFPDGLASLKRCVDKAAEKGIMLGAHNLSNFVHTHDPLVTPIPDKRLSKVGSSVLSKDIEVDQTEIIIEDDLFFRQMKNNFLRSVIIEDEIIRYRVVSKFEPWTLLDCQRGAYGTYATSHEKETKISKLADGGYKVFLTDMELGLEMSETMAEIYNKTGLRQISFDGLEGNRSSGLGSYGEILFTKKWFDTINGDIKSHYIADASRTNHYFWHIFTRMNWGEPWYDGFRESQTDSRLHNQTFFKRNFIPAMLGWFQLKDITSIEDVEWMLTKSAAFDAGYSFVIYGDVINENHQSDKILNLLGEWEKARMGNAFSVEQQERMQKMENEFRLEKTGEKSWNLFQIHTNRFEHQKKVLQPGEPHFSTFEFKNDVDEQTMNFILTSADGSLENIVIEVDNYKEIKIPITMNKNDILYYSGGDSAILYSKNWEILKEVEIDKNAFMMASGGHSITFDCIFLDGEKSFAKLELRFSEKAEPISVQD